jgi:hypothetical protein
MGGTVAGVQGKSDARLEISQDEYLTLEIRKTRIEIPYGEINNLEYGMHVSRRYMEAVLISPIFLISKKRDHFLTIGYADPNGKQQAIVLRIGKDEIRPVLVSLEARTGRSIEYQDEEARKAGKG